MKDEIDKLLQKVGKIMQEQLERRNFADVTMLSPLLKRLQDLQTRREAIEAEVAEIEAALASLNGKKSPQRFAELSPVLSESGENSGLGRGKPQTLRIKIDWKANNRARNEEEICEHTAAASMEALIERLIAEFGDSAIQKLEHLRINRGPLISKTPAKDFLNKAQGRLYGNKKIRGTDYYLLTHSSTDQKLNDIKRISRVLGLAQGSVKVEQLDRQNAYL
jgi:hypothetical protein